jgi:mannose-1-phosphate guanylyltransferase
LTTGVRKAIVLCGGKATRLAAMTNDRPKPMLEVGGRPLVEHTIRQLSTAGVEQIGMNLYQHPDAVRRHFGDGSRFGVEIRYSIEPEPYGTAGALRPFRDMLGEPFFVAYGDNLTTCDFAALARAHDEHGGIGTIALFWRDDVTKHSAVAMQPDMRIMRFIEKPKAEEAPSQWISAGMMVLEPEVFRYIPSEGVCDIGFHLFPELLKARERVYGYYMGEHEGLWWIDTPEDYARVSRLCEAGFPP